MKRTFSLALIVLLLLSSCGSDTNTDTADTNTPGTNAGEAAVGDTESSETNRSDITYDLPEKKFSGRTIRFSSVPAKTYEIAADEYTGAAENDIVYDRNLKISEQYDCSIEYVAIDNNQNDAVNNVAAGVNAYEIAGMINYLSGSAITSNCFLNWNEIPYVNLENPWYIKFVNDSFTVNNKIFTVTGDLSISATTLTMAMFYNPSVGEKYGCSIDEYYEMVEKGTWTIDNFYSIIDPIYEDINGDGTRDAGDIYGYGTGLIDDIDIWLTAFAQPVTGRDSKGFLTLEMVDEKCVNIIEKLNQFIHVSNGVYATDGSTASEFTSNLRVFSPVRFSECFGTLREMENEYMVLPLPKWDEAQTNYRTTMIDEFTIFSVMKTVPAADYEFVGILFEAMNAESYKMVIPVYYDEALKGKYSTDTKMAEMIDFIMNGRSFDIGFTFGANALGRFPYCIRDLVKENSTDIASKYAGVEGVINEGLKTINQCFE